MYVLSNRSIVSVVFGALVITGCASQQRDSFTVGSVPEDYRTNHPIVLSQKEQTLDVAVASGARALDIATRSNIEAFANAFANGENGTLVVLEPSGSVNAAAAQRVRKDVINAAIKGGANRGQIVVQNYDASAHGPAAPIRLSYHSVAATTGDCGKWTGDLTENPENKHYADFGCATQKNLAAIISNPNDLMGPRASSQIDAAQRAAVYETYQRGPQSIPSEVTY